MKRENLILLLFICCAAGWASCNNRTSALERNNYTHIDSLTDTYLNLQDSLLIAWNVMAKDENEKLRSIHEVLQAMSSSDSFNKNLVASLEQRLEQVKRIRFNQKTIANPHIVEEYDFASNSLISEIVSLAESNLTFIQKKELQSLIDAIKEADQRVNYFRFDYDFIAQKFNRFLDNHQSHLKEIDQNAVNGKRPLFQMASDN